MFIYLDRFKKWLNNSNGREIHLWCQSLHEFSCLSISAFLSIFFLKHCLIQWSTMETESLVMLQFSTSCGNSQVEGNEILLGLPRRESMLSLSPIRHQRTLTGWCVLERWQYVFCPHRVIRFVVKLAAETWSICPIQSTLSFPHLCSKALFMKTKTGTWRLPCKCHILWARQLLKEGLFSSFFWQAFNPWPGSSCPPAPPPHSTEMDTANFCLRPALAMEPTRRETACALISKIFMSCFG